MMTNFFKNNRIVPVALTGCRMNPRTSVRDQRPQPSMYDYNEKFEGYRKRFEKMGQLNLSTLDP